MVYINGSSIDVAAITLKDYLLKNGYSISKIVVEINNKIISKANYENVILSSGDVVEIVSFVGGG
ncbi:sulfur carrier protein [Lachnotalea glycerini]|uniref:Sulfur carrier protein n=1 Tax=Lachnotalea glycerini TaxID=1763509 RepID=A0A318EWX5_9FIRM|nr:sulfur carrier protein ThiS [Lachnotalea glycerini]PXV95983.1 sulfur carrier protein [Lachnotalea glycerini]